MNFMQCHGLNILTHADKQKKCGGDDVYVTELREPLSQSAQDQTFFDRLDAQLTKINKFYKRKEGEYIARAGLLEKQMLALLQLEEDMARRGLVPVDSYWSPNDHPRPFPGTFSNCLSFKSILPTYTYLPTFNLLLTHHSY